MISRWAGNFKNQSKGLSFTVIVFIVLLSLSGLTNLPTTHTGTSSATPWVDAKILPLQASAEIYLPRIIAPALVLNGSSFEIVVDAPTDAAGWQASVYREYQDFTLSLSDITYNSSTGQWNLNATVAPTTNPDLYDLHLELTTGGETLTLVEWNAVAVYESFPESFTIIHITDSHIFSNPSYRDVQLRKTIHEANLMKADLIIFTGDLVETPSSTSFNRVKSCIRSSRIPVLATTGNHDLPGPLYEEILGPQYHTHEFGDVFLIMADTGNDAYFGPDQIAQIEQDLIAHSSAKLKILGFHYPVWGISTADEFGNETDWHGRPQLYYFLDDYQDIRDICYEQGVDIVLHGHNHNDQVHMDNGTLHIMTTVNGGVTWEPMGSFWGYRPIRVENYVLTSWSWKESVERSWSQPIRWVNESLNGIAEFDREPLDFYTIDPGLHFEINNHREIPLVNQTIDVIVPPLTGNHYVAEGANLINSINGSDGWLLQLNASIPAGDSKTIRVYPATSAAPVFDSITIPDAIAGEFVIFWVNCSNPVSGVHYVEIRYSLNGGSWETQQMRRLGSTNRYRIDLEPYQDGDILEVVFRAYDYSGLSADSQTYFLEFPETTTTPTSTPILVPLPVIIGGAIVAVVVVIVVVIVIKKR
jgi:predicted phosphodiesterase